MCPPEKAKNNDCCVLGICPTVLHYCFQYIGRDTLNGSLLPIAPNGASDL